MIISYLIFFNRNNNCNETKHIYLNVYIISIKKLFLFNLINLVSINMCINLTIINLYTGYIQNTQRYFFNHNSSYSVPVYQE